MKCHQNITLLQWNHSGTIGGKLRGTSNPLKVMTRYVMYLRGRMVALEVFRWGSRGFYSGFGFYTV